MQSYGKTGAVQKKIFDFWFFCLLRLSRQSVVVNGEYTGKTRFAAKYLCLCLAFLVFLRIFAMYISENHPYIIIYEKIPTKNRLTANVVVRFPIAADFLREGRQ